MTDQRHPRRPHLRTVFGWTLVGLAVVQGIALVAYLLASRPVTTPALPAPTFSTTTEATTSQPGGATTSTTTLPQSALSTPDLLGIDRDRAVEILVDNGVDLDSITLEELPWVSPAGVVVGQHPGPGEQQTGEVVLTVSAEASTPDLIGHSQDDSRSTLGAVGAAPGFVATYTPGAMPGTVTSQNPGPGEPLPPVVELTVAADPADIPLTELRDVGRDSCRPGQLRANGIEFTTGIRCSGRVTDPIGWIDYDLGRDYETLTVTVGVSDEARDTTAEFRFRVVADGEAVVERVLAFGQSEALEVDVREVLRLRLETTAVSSAEETRTNEVVWGDPTLLGDPEVVSAVLGS